MAAGREIGMMLIIFMYFAVLVAGLTYIAMRFDWLPEYCVAVVIWVVAITIPFVPLFVMFGG